MYSDWSCDLICIESRSRSSLVGRRVKRLDKSSLTGAATLLLRWAFRELFGLEALQSFRKIDEVSMVAGGRTWVVSWTTLGIVTSLPSTEAHLWKEKPPILDPTRKDSSDFVKSLQLGAAFAFELLSMASSTRLSSAGPLRARCKTSSEIWLCGWWLLVLESAAAEVLFLSGGWVFSVVDLLGTLVLSMLDFRCARVFAAMSVFDSRDLCVIAATELSVGSGSGLL